MKVLVLGAGGPAGVNTCQALYNHDVMAADENREHLVWCEPYAATVHLPELTVGAVNRLEADFIVPQPDSVTMWLADHAHMLQAETCLPDRRTVALCQDKFEAGLAFRRAGLRDDRIELFEEDSQLQYPMLGKPWPVWIRARHGAGAKAAIAARKWDEAAAWLWFWEMRDKTMELVFEDFLPGRDLAWSSLWKDGQLQFSFLRERVEYIYPGLTPEGLTGTPTIARIVIDDAVNRLAEASVLAVDDRPNGFMSVDLREDKDGVPRPTEINAGRTFTTFGLWSMECAYNLIDCLFDKPWPEPVRDPFPAGLTLYRHIDCGATFR